MTNSSTAFGSPMASSTLAQVLLDLLRLDGVLGKDAAGGLLAFGGLVDLAGDVGLGRGGLAELAEVEERLLLASRFLRRSAGRD